MEKAFSDCVDPAVRSYLLELADRSASGPPAYNGNDIGDLLVAGVHWRGCPVCRSEFPGLLPEFKRVGIDLASKIRANLEGFRQEFLNQKDSLLREFGPSASTCSSIIVECAMAEYDFSIWVPRGQNALALVGSVDGKSSVGGGTGASVLSNCREFVSSLDPELQQFLFLVAYCRDLFSPIFERALKDRVSNYDDEVCDKIGASLNRSELDPATLFSIIEQASARSDAPMASWPRGGGDGFWEFAGKLLEDKFASLHSTLEDGFDSLKAGQAESLLQIQRHRRLLSEYRPSIIDCIGETLYSRLHEGTQTAIEKAEYYYDVAPDPDSFGECARLFANGYESELSLRIFSPFLMDLLAEGKDCYSPTWLDGKGYMVRPKALIMQGKINKRGMTVGNFALYLGGDEALRAYAFGRGFDVNAISRDSHFVAELRNEAVHDMVFDRPHADKLRRRILHADGALSRLHPTVPL